MYLVDTSVLIDYFRERENDVVKFFDKILDEGIPFGITSIIYQEVLQGAATKRDLNYLINYLSTQRFYNPKDDIISYQAAATLYFDCRKNGITIRSTVDCIIAQTAIEHDLILLHNDKDYSQIAKVTSSLKLH